MVQVAVDGWWEDAIAVPLPASATELHGLLDALGSDDVAVEMLWPGPPVVFAGARFGSLDVPPLTDITATADWTPSRALALLASGPLGPPVRAELGAVNAWRTVGSLHLELDASPAAIERALADRPRLATCSHPVALEIVHAHPREAWWAIEVSARQGDLHVVQVERASAVLRSIA